MPQRWRGEDSTRFETSKEIESIDLNTVINCISKFRMPRELDIYVLAKKEVEELLSS